MFRYQAHMSLLAYWAAYMIFLYQSSLMLLTSSSGLDSYRSRKMPGSGSTFKRPCPFLVFFKLSYFLADLFENCYKECDLEIEICSL